MFDRTRTFIVLDVPSSPYKRVNVVTSGRAISVLFGARSATDRTTDEQCEVLMA